MTKKPYYFKVENLKGQDDNYIGYFMVLAPDTDRAIVELKNNLKLIQHTGVLTGGVLYIDQIDTVDLQRNNNGEVFELFYDCYN